MSAVGVHGFPAVLTSFVSRARAVREVAGLLEDYRLVTVTGPGGGGQDPTGWRGGGPGGGPVCGRGVAGRASGRSSGEEVRQLLDLLSGGNAQELF
jgi:hypothetical protein